MKSVKNLILLKCVHTLKIYVRGNYEFVYLVCENPDDGDKVSVTSSRSGVPVEYVCDIVDRKRLEQVFADYLENAGYSLQSPVKESCDMDLTIQVGRKVREMHVCFQSMGENIGFCGFQCTVDGKQCKKRCISMDVKSHRGMLAYIRMYCSEYM